MTFGWRTTPGWRGERYNYEDLALEVRLDPYEDYAPWPQPAEDYRQGVQRLEQPAHNEPRPNLCEWPGCASPAVQTYCRHHEAEREFELTREHRQHALAFRYPVLSFPKVLTVAPRTRTRAALTEVNR